MSTIGIRIKQKRLEKGLSQAELAKRMGYKSKSTINKIEKGINDIVQSNIVKFAEILGTTPAFLMGWEQDEIDATSEIQKDVAEYDHSKEMILNDFMVELSDMNFDSRELAIIRQYAHAVKENTSVELHKAYVELFVDMLKLDLSIDDLKDVYTYAQFIKSKK